MHYVTHIPHQMQKHNFSVTCPSALFMGTAPSAPNDVGINTNNTSTPTHNQISGLITRARARQLNNQVSSFLASYSSYLDNGNMCSILLGGNDGQGRNGVAFMPATFRFQNCSNL
jgi:hypothetical protein